MIMLIMIVSYCDCIHICKGLTTPNWPSHTYKLSMRLCKNISPTPYMLWRLLELSSTYVPMSLVSFSKQNPVGMEDQAELACFVSKCLLGKLHVANVEENNSLLVGVSP